MSGDDELRTLAAWRDRALLAERELRRLQPEVERLTAEVAENFVLPSSEGHEYETEVFEADDGMLGLRVLSADESIVKLRAEVAALTAENARLRSAMLRALDGPAILMRDALRAASRGTTHPLDPGAQSVNPEPGTGEPDH